jgi:hypothetical protein
MTKVKLDVGATVDFLDKGELDDALAEHRAAGDAAEYEKLRGVKYIRAPRIQGTVYNGTIGNAGGTLYPTGTLYATLGGPPWGPLQGYSWSIRRIAAGGLSLAGTSACDFVGVYRNTNTSPLTAVLSANVPVVTFPTLGLVCHGGDSILIGHVPNQVTSNVYGTLASTTTQIAVDFDVIEVPTEMLGKLA